MRGLVLGALVAFGIACSASDSNAQVPRKGKGGDSAHVSHQRQLALNQHILSTGIDPSQVTWVENMAGMHCEEFPQYRNQQGCEFWSDPSGVSWVTVRAHIIEQGQGNVMAVLKRLPGQSQYRLVGSWHYKMHQLAAKPGASRKFDVEWVADSGPMNAQNSSGPAVTYDPSQAAPLCKKGDRRAECQKGHR